MFYPNKTGPGGRIRYNDSLRTGRFGVRITVGARFFAPIWTGSEAHSVSCTTGTGYLSRE